MLLFKKKVFMLLLVFLLCLFIWVGLYWRGPSTRIMLIEDFDSTDCCQHKYMINDFLVRKDDTPEFFKRLPNLSHVEWPKTEYTKLPIVGAPLPVAFEPVMSRGQNILLHKLLDVFAQNMHANGLSDRYMIHGATLLGSFRHHDFIPWDDDVDVLVDVSIRPTVQNILKKLAPHYQLTEGGLRDKFHTEIYPFTVDKNDVQLSRLTSARPWGWPFLDISYYSVNETHINELAVSYNRYYHYSKSIVFPLMYRPLGPKWYPAPRDPIACLHASYTPSSKCTMFGYSHILESAGPVGSVECRELGFRYPFVEHTLRDQDRSGHNSTENDETVWSRENLIILANVSDRAVIHSICLPVPEHNIKSETYGFNYRLD